MIFRGGFTNPEVGGVAFIIGGSGLLRSICVRGSRSGLSIPTRGNVENYANFSRTGSPSRTRVRPPLRGCVRMRACNAYA